MPQRSVSARRFTRTGDHYVRSIIDYPDYDDYLIWGPLSAADARVLERLLNETSCDVTYNGSGPFGLDIDDERDTDASSTFAFDLGQDVRIKYGDYRGETGTIRDRWRAKGGEPAYLLYIDQGNTIQTGIFSEEQFEKV